MIIYKPAITAAVMSASAFDPACVKTHTSEKCRKYNSLTRYRAVCAQYDLTLMMRNRSKIFHARCKRWSFYTAWTHSGHGADSRVLSQITHSGLQRSVRY